MNKEILRSYWKNPQSVASNHLDELNKLCIEYPYAVGLKQLYCKALIIHQDLNFEKILKTTAIQTAQRGVLRFWLLGDTNENAKYIYPNLEVNEEVEEDFSLSTPITELKNEVENKKEDVLENKVQPLSILNTNTPEIDQESEKINTIENPISLYVVNNDDYKEIEVQKTDEEVVDWDTIGPVKITLLPVIENNVTQPSELQSELDNSENLVSQDIVLGNHKIETENTEDLIDTHKLKEYNTDIKTNEIESRLFDEVIEKEDDKSILDKQILQAVIVSSEYKIPEIENENKSFTKSKKVSFVDWLDRLEKGELNDEEFAFRKKAEKIIDQFLANQPKIKIKREFFSADNYVKKGVEESEDIVSETLINIYIKQGHIQKAIEGYQILQKKFPEKHEYFQQKINDLI